MRTLKKQYTRPRLALYGPIDTVTAFKAPGPADSFGAANGIDVTCPSGFPANDDPLCGLDIAP